MTRDSGKNSNFPDWYQAGIDHVWLPYAQMKTVLPTLPVACTQGTRIVLADRRELIDGIASWWTACHGYNQPHIREAVARQLDQMPHVMFGGLAHEQAREWSFALGPVYVGIEAHAVARPHERGFALLDRVGLGLGAHAGGWTRLRTATSSASSATGVPLRMSSANSSFGTITVSV